MSKLGEIGHRLYTGEVSYDFIGHRRRWYLVSAIMIAVSILSLAFRGLDFGIEFKGGADFKATTQVTAQTVDSMRDALRNSGVPDLDEATVNTIGNNQVRVQTRTLDPTEEVPKVRAAIANEVGINPDQVAYNLIGASWGSQITERALIALASVHHTGRAGHRDLFPRRQDVGRRTHRAGSRPDLDDRHLRARGFHRDTCHVDRRADILGYSLYDTVVVFDKVRENVRDLRSSTTRTYSEAANLAVNQVLVRSINTTVIGVLPVAALLFTGAVILGEGPLKDLALALFVGMVAGAYSSIFIATPILAQMKEREPDMKKLAARVRARRAKESQKERVAEPATPAPAEVATASATEDPEPSEDAEPSNAELEQASSASGNGAKRVSVSYKSDVRSHREGAAKRPQPQNKPRSQRKK